MADRLEVFVMHVQGSGLIELDDGSAVRLTFDGKNGHPYSSIAKLLVARGHLTLEEADLEGMLAWLRAQPDAAGLPEREQILHILQRAGARRGCAERLMRR